MAHVVLVEELRVAPKLLVEAAQGRALVAGDHRAGGEPAPAIGAVLIEHQPYEALDPGEEYSAVLQEILVVERDLAGSRRSAVGARNPATGAQWRPSCAAAQGRRRHEELLRLIIG